MSVVQIKNPSGIIQIRSLKLVRLKKGFSLRKLAKSVGLTHMAIGNFEKLKIGLKSKHIQKICNVLEVEEKAIVDYISVDKKEIDKKENQLQRKIMGDIALKKRKPDPKIVIESNAYNKLLSCKWTKG